MKKPVTNDDLMKKYFASDEVVKIKHEVAEEVAKIHGGVRAGAGRKSKTAKERAKTRSFCLNDKDYQVYLELGGVKFIKDAVAQYKQRMGIHN